MADRGLDIAQSHAVLHPAPRSVLVEGTVPSGFSMDAIVSGIPAMTKFDTRCLLVQISYLESLNDPSKVVGDVGDWFRGNVLVPSDSNRLGKYQVSQYLLKKHGYKDANGNWTGKDGIDSDDLFLLNGRVQDNVMRQCLTESYELMIRVGAIRIGDPKYVVAGMLAVAYHYHDMTAPSSQGVPISSLRAVGDYAADSYYVIKARDWREYGEYSDFQGRSAHLYYNAGKYAIQNLAADIAV